MNRKLVKLPLMILLLNIIFLPFLANTAKAAGEFNVVEVYDPQGLVIKNLYFNESADSIQLKISGQKAVKVTYTSYTDDSFSTIGTTKTYTAAQYGWTFFDGIGFNCNVAYTGTLYDASDNVLVSAKLTITGLVNPVCNSESNGEGMGGKECDNCAIFSCPGWGEYMDKLDDIKAAIPPPPNWNQVADVFRDSIAPQIKKDMAELIGTAPTPTLPTLPKAPDKPSPPAMLEKLDDQGIKAPTGNEAPGLDDSTFTADDLKSSAPVIQEREDPTGGFKIDNPIDSLPSQEEFKKNIPKEGIVPLPGKPKDPENIAPTPPEQPNKAPTPGEDFGKAPIPGLDSNKAPIPGGDSGKAPIPGNDGSKAPIPGGDSGKVPIPGGG